MQRVSAHCGFESDTLRQSCALRSPVVSSSTACWYCCSVSSVPVLVSWVAARQTSRLLKYVATPTSFLLPCAPWLVSPGHSCVAHCRRSLLFY
jgi:hypothetical protein